MHKKCEFSKILRFLQFFFLKVNELLLDLSVSIGISIYPDNTVTVESLLKKSDIAMYKAKETRKNSFQFFDERYKGELNFEQALLHALDNDEFCVYYQPIIDNNNECYALEALLKWDRPQFGLVMPSDFIPILKKQKNMEKVGGWIFQQASSMYLRYSASTETLLCFSGQFKFSSRAIFRYKINKFLIYIF